MTQYSRNIYRDMRYSSRKNERKKAVSTIVFTAQLFAVMLILLLMWLFGKSNTEGKELLHERILYLANDYSVAENSALQRHMNSFRHIFYSGVKKSMPQCKRQKNENQTVTIPDYNYLNFEDLGRGGMNPVQFTARQANEQMPPPRDAVLSPVFASVAPIPPTVGIVSSVFGWREHPITEALDFHTGIDIAAPEGKIIFAALPGVVTEVGFSNIYGNYVLLDHGNGLQTSYSHCSEIIVREGMNLRQGERIAGVGQTGVATGPHLHFSVIVDGYYTNPEWLLKGYIEEKD